VISSVKLEVYVHAIKEVSEVQTDIEIIQNSKELHKSRHIHSLRDF
jgi:hypothetical protein